MNFTISPTNFKKILLVGLLIGVTILGYSTVYRAALGEKSRGDLTVYLRAAEAIQQNENIYAVENERHWHYVYLPLLAILMLPFLGLPLWLASLFWYLISLAALGGTVWGLRSFFKNREHLFWIVLTCFVFALPPILNTFTRGQLGILSLFLTLLTLILDQNGKRFTAGFILGFAIVLKMSPLLILPLYFLLRKNWRAIAGCAVGGILFGALIPITIFGPELYLRYLQIYYEAISGGTGDLAHQSYLWGELFTPFANDNQSFYAVLTRLYWKTESAFIGNSNAVIRYINSFFLFSLIGSVLFSYFKAKSKTHLVPSIREGFVYFTLLSCIMLFTSPVSQVHHFTPIVMLNAAAFLQIQHRPSFKKPLLSAMIICLLFFAFGMIFNFLAVIGLQLWGTLLLWFTILFSASKK